MTTPYFPYGPTQGFKDAQRYGALLVLARFTVYQNGRPTGKVYEANMSVGSVTIDRNSTYRRSGEITIETIPTVPPGPLVPSNPNSLLSPFGTELYVETGINTAGNNIPHAEVQWVPNGLFAVSMSTVDDPGTDLTITLQLYDRSWTIAQRVLRNPYNFPAAGGNFAAEIQALLNMVWNEQTGVAPLQYNIVPTSAVVPKASYDQGSDPWQAALDMANAIGYELFFDANGVVTGRPIPNPLQQQPVWNFTDDVTQVQGIEGTGSTGLLGDAYSTPIEVSVVMTRDQIHNDVVVQGTGTANAAVYNGQGLETTPQPLLAQAKDNNPASPTYVKGPMGDVINFVQSNLVTAAGAQNMANNDLSVALSSAWTCTLTIAPNPFLNIDDVVIVTRPRVGLNKAVMVIDTITQTWNYADTQSITGRILSNQKVT
jgi:hypothetical protein